LKQYKAMEESGQDNPTLNPHSPRGTMEELCKAQLEKNNKPEENEKTVKDLISEKIRRAKNWKPYVPFDMAEHEANKEGSFINKFLFRVGTNDNYNKIRSRCKAEGVSVGSLGLASSFMAMACVNASTTDGEWEGMVDQHMDIPVNIRARTGMNGDEYAAFYVTEVGLKCDVLPKTGVWDVARDIQGQLKGAIERDEHLLFAKAKGEWENGQETKDMAASSWQEGKVMDVIVSNLMFYKYPTDLGWGKVTSLFCPVSVAVPFCSNLELLFLACDGKFSYTLIHSPDKNNEKTARSYMDYFVRIMEESHSDDGKCVSIHLKEEKV